MLKNKIVNLFIMSKKYIYLENLSKTQIELVNNFNKNSKINYDLCSCEVCHSKDYKTIFNNDRYGIDQKTCCCNQCGFIFSNPRLSKESTKFFYNSNLYRILYDGISENFKEDDLYQNALDELNQYKPVLPKKPNFKNYYDQLYFDFINDQINDYETVLDIGTGRGKKLIDFEFIGKKAEGIEPSKIYNKVHLELGLNSQVGFLDDVKKQYDLVVITQVLEHLTNLNEVVNKLSNITKKYLFIEVPGHKEKLQSIQNAHNFYFSVNTLNHFVLNNKFKLVKIESALDNEDIFAIYKKTEKNGVYIFNYKNEKKIIKKIYKKYLIRYFWNFVLLKILKLPGTEQKIRALYRKIKSYF